MCSKLRITFNTIFFIFMFIETKLVFSENVTEKNDYDFIASMFYGPRKNWKTSNLGAILFKNKYPDNFILRNKNYTVMLWKYWDAMRGVNLRDIEAVENALQDCSVQNCLFTKFSGVRKAHAVVVSMGQKHLPFVKKRDVTQRWILWNDEPPTPDLNLKKYANLFNWTMTYRTDSDIPISYGRTLPLDRPLIDDVTDEAALAELVPNWDKKRRDVIAAVLVYKCVPRIRKFIVELKKHMEIHVYGNCSNDAELTSCSEKNWMECKMLNDYLFYFVLEKSRCRQYLTEKSFIAYSLGAIPVIRGPLLEDCQKLLPPNSFIHADNYRNIGELVKYIKKIAKYNDLFLWYHRWRNYYKVFGEYGNEEKKSLLFCRVCEALNYNDKAVKIYDEDELRLFFDAKLVCDKPRW